MAQTNADRKKSNQSRLCGCRQGERKGRNKARDCACIGGDTDPSRVHLRQMGGYSGFLVSVAGHGNLIDLRQTKHAALPGSSAGSVSEIGGRGYRMLL